MLGVQVRDWSPRSIRSASLSYESTLARSFPDCQVVVSVYSIKYHLTHTCRLGLEDNPSFESTITSSTHALRSWIRWLDKQWPILRRKIEEEDLEIESNELFSGRIETEWLDAFNLSKCCHSRFCAIEVFYRWIWKLKIQTVGRQRHMLRGTNLVSIRWPWMGRLRLWHVHSDFR